MKILFKKILQRLPEPKFTRFRNLKLFDWMNQHAQGKKVLNLGSGVGNFDHYLSENIRPVNLDIDPCKPKLDIIADAHFLPFKNESFDIVYSIAVLEHVKKPWIVADEITRVLRSGGYLVLEVPFLNVIHDEHDYFRFTDKGIKSLFDEEKFEVIFEQVGSGGGSFLSVFLYVYLKQFIPTRKLKIIWELCMRYIFCLFKYADILIDKSETMRITANSFSYIGKKR
ncbi:MAG: class I SAM-dependent methyltransferase [Candidatus Omnitrophica bacterium]|nr:class I SAM-dependent methyltransferase [Candidatus Omnitrophota bacterium]